MWEAKRSYVVRSHGNIPFYLTFVGPIRWFLLPQWINRKTAFRAPNVFTSIFSLKCVFRLPVLQMYYSGLWPLLLLMSWGLRNCSLNLLLSPKPEVSEKGLIVAFRITQSAGSLYIMTASCSRCDETCDSLCWKRFWAHPSSSSHGAAFCFCV